MSLSEERFHQYSSYKSGIWTGQIKEEPPADPSIEPSREIAELNAQRRRNEPEQKNDTNRCTHDTAARILTAIKNAVFFSGCWLWLLLYCTGLPLSAYWWAYLLVPAFVSVGNLNLYLIGKRSFSPADTFNTLDMKNVTRRYKEQIQKDPPAVKDLYLQGSGVLFGEKDGKTIGKPMNKDGHILVLGGSGSGKSSCIAIPTLNRYTGGVLAIDIKDGGELQRKSRTDSAVHIFRPGSPESLGYDPFWFLDRDRPEAGIREIAYSLIPTNPKNPNDFWVMSQQRYLTGALAYCYYMKQSFAEACRTIYSLPSHDLLTRIQESGYTFATSTMSDFYDMAAETLGGILGGVSNGISVCATDRDIMDALGRRPLMSPEMLLHGERIFICIPEHKLDVYRELLQLIISQFLRWFEQLGDNETAPVLFLLDEFSRLGRYDKLINGLATLRSKKVTIMLLTQSISQLDALYGSDNRKVMVDNCSYKVILNASDADSQQYFSKLIGTYTHHQRSYTQGRSSSNTVSEHEQPIIRPEQFTTLDEVILLSPYGLQRLRKKPYYREKL